jgi:oligoribonuclease NrnB/cAMP/cGMP phosphodiesterase (DHH superfamily)
MEQDVIDDSALSLERKSLLPGTGFFVPDEIRDERKDEELAARAAGAEVLVVADPDADGLACAAIVREVYGEAALIPSSPHELEDGLAAAAEYGEPGATVFVCDLCPDRFEYVAEDLPALVEHADEVRWFDHHQWDDDVAAAVRDAGADLTIGGDDECTADVAVRVLEDGGETVPDRLRDLAAVTRDHDLWLKADERSDDLADYAVWVEDDEEYVETVREHGPDLPEDVLAFLAERRVEKQRLVQRAVDRASMESVGDLTVGVTYGRCSQNEVADALREQGADAAVVVKPAGSASIRGSDDFERCHEVAAQVEGGGHPKAAGCKPDIYHDVMDYAHHWTTQGAVAKREILRAFESLTDEGAGEAADD